MSKKLIISKNDQSKKMISKFIKSHIREFFPLSIVANLHIAKIITCVKVWLPRYLQIKYEEHPYFYCLAIDNKFKNWLSISFSPKTFPYIRQCLLAGKYKKLKYMLSNNVFNTIIRDLAFTIGNYKFCQYLIQNNIFPWTDFTTDLNCYKLLINNNRGPLLEYYLTTCNLEILNYYREYDENYFFDVKIKIKDCLDILQFLVQHNISFNEIGTIKFLVQEDLFDEFLFLFKNVNCKSILYEIMYKCNGNIYSYLADEYIPSLSLQEKEKIIKYIVSNSAFSGYYESLFD